MAYGRESASIRTAVTQNWPPLVVGWLRRTSSTVAKMSVGASAGKLPEHRAAMQWPNKLKTASHALVLFWGMDFFSCSVKLETSNCGKNEKLVFEYM